MKYIIFAIISAFIIITLCGILMVVANFSASSYLVGCFITSFGFYGVIISGSMYQPPNGNSYKKHKTKRYI